MERQTRSIFYFLRSAHFQTVVSIILQQRDILILEELSLCSFLSLDQIVRLAFRGNTEAGRKRIEKLVAAGVLVTERIPFSRRKIVTMTHATTTAKSFIAKRTLVKQPRLVLAHDLLIRDVKIALRTTADRLEERIAIEEFLIDPAHVRLAVGSEFFVPDAFVTLAVETRGSVNFFIEVDRGTEPHTRLMKKVDCYRTLRRQALCGRWPDAGAKRIQPYLFRVLFLFESLSRAGRFLEKLREAGIKKFILVATLDAFLSDPFGKVWFTAGTHELDALVN
jgi:hypothetical protein